MSKVDGGRGGGLKKLLRTFEAEILKIHFLRKFSSYQVCNFLNFCKVVDILNKAISKDVSNVC